MGSVLPPRGSSASRFSSRPARPVRLGRDPSPSFQPASESHPGSRAPVHRCVRSREVSRPLSATQPYEPPLPRLPPSGHVASPHFLRASTPCSRNGLPDISQPGTLSGFGPSELDLARIASPLGATSPPAIGRTVFLRGPAMPNLVRSPRSRCPPSPLGLSFPGRLPWLSLEDQHGQFRIDDPPARPSRRSAFAVSWPRFRGFLPLPVGASASESLRRAAPWLSWVSPPWGLP